MKGAWRASLIARGVWSHRQSWLGLVMGLVLAGCATGPNANPADPLEPLNRRVYKFNDVLDRTLLAPFSPTHPDLTPTLVQRGLLTFFGHL